MHGMGKMDMDEEGSAPPAGPENREAMIAALKDVIALMEAEDVGRMLPEEEAPTEEPAATEEEMSPEDEELLRTKLGSMK